MLSPALAVWNASRQAVSERTTCDECQVLPGKISDFDFERVPDGDSMLPGKTWQRPQINPRLPCRLDSCSFAVLSWRC